MLLQEAICGDNIGINIKPYIKNIIPHTGDVMCIDNIQIDANPPKSCKKFSALVFVQDHPGQLKCGNKINDNNDINYKGGFTPSIHIRIAKSPCQMIEIEWKIGKSTNNEKVENALFIEAADQARVTFIPKLPMVVCTFDECKPLGRIAAMYS